MSLSLISSNIIRVDFESLNPMMSLVLKDVQGQI